jgi:hypothetical protein
MMPATWRPTVTTPLSIAGAVQVDDDEDATNLADTDMLLPKMQETDTFGLTMECKTVISCFPEFKERVGKTLTTVTD